MTLIVSYCFYLTVSLAAHDGDFNTSMAAQPIVLILEYFCPNADLLATDAVAPLPTLDSCGRRAAPAAGNSPPNIRYI